EAVPTALSLTSASTAAVDRSNTTHEWPPFMSRRTILAPMRPSPIIPSCIWQFPEKDVRSIPNQTQLPAQLSLHFGGGPGSVHGHDEFLASKQIENRPGLGVIVAQALAHGFGRVIGPRHERPLAHVADAGLGGVMRNQVIIETALGAQAPVD